MEHKLTKEKSVESLKSKKRHAYQGQKSNMVRLCLTVVNYQWFDNNSFLAKWSTISNPVKL